MTEATAQADAIKAAVIKQLHATWHELQAACEQIPEEHWHTGEIDHLIPARHGRNENLCKAR